MFCETCGCELPDDSKFCTVCGAPVVAPSQVAANATPTGEPIITKSAPTPAPSGQKQKRTYIIAAIVCAIAVVAVAIAIFAFVKHKVYEESHQTTHIEVAFTFANPPAGGILIPINISGTDLDGKNVSLDVAAKQEGFTADLLRGSYEISVAGNPVSGDGQVYAPSGSKLTLTVDENGYATGAGDSSDSGQVLDVQQTFNLSVVKPADVTDEMISSIENWMNQDRVDSAEEQAIVQAVKSKTSQAREEARLEAEKQAALAANPTYVGGSSEMNLTQPAQFTGTVKMERHKNPGNDKVYDVYFLQLPANASFDGSQYSLQTSDKIILSDKLSSYVGKVVTISARYVISPTADQRAAVSPVNASGAQVVKVF